MSLPPLRHVPHSLLQPFDQVQSITHDLALAAQSQHASSSYCALSPSDCLDARIDLYTALAQCRSTMESAYATANAAVTTLAEQRQAAITARLAKLNRDWYTSHLDADIDSYERADLSFDPPDLISAQEIRASITNKPDLEKFDNMSPAELMARRFNVEKVERAREKVNVNRQEKARENVIKDLRSKLDREDKRDAETLKWIQLSSDLATAYGVDLSALAAERAAARAKGRDPNQLGLAQEQDEDEDEDEDTEDGEQEASQRPSDPDNDKTSIDNDDIAATPSGDGAESVGAHDVVMSDLPTDSEMDADARSMATSGRSTPESSLMSNTDVEMVDVGQAQEEEEEEEGALI